MSDWKLLNTSTASGASSVEFTDLTGYKIFKFVFVDFKSEHSTSGDHLQFQVNASGQTGYNETITSTYFQAYHNEADNQATLAYNTGQDAAQSTGSITLFDTTQFASDATVAGEFLIWNPLSTVYVKHFTSRITGMGDGSYTKDVYVAGYVNVQSAISEIKFFGAYGNWTGTIKQYGLVAT